MKRRAQLKPFDRYAYYHRAVQSTAVDCDFVAKVFREMRGRRAAILREDFCAAFAICCEWVKRNPENVAYGVDLDAEPLDYGRTHYLPKLTSKQQSRIHLNQGSVLTAKLPPVDVTIALNFSFYIFKTRVLLRQYFRRAYAGLKRDGLLITDCFGGKDCQAPNEEATILPGFTYFWDQTSFDPVTNEAQFYIHFKRKGEKRREKVFGYDWRMWTIPEIREAMMEAGFKRTHVYWEGTTRAGHGDGKFKRVEHGEDCDGWVAYVVGEK